MYGEQNPYAGLLYPYINEKCPYCGSDTLWAIDGYQYKDFVFKAVKLKN